eukprot:2856037-Rhodomonas_salina.2
MTGAGHDGSVHTRRDSGEILQQGCAHEDHPGISAPHLDDLARTSTNGSFTCMRFCPNALAHFLFAQLQLTALGARQGPDVPETQRLEEKKIQTVKKTQLYDQRMALVAPPLLFQQRAGGGSCESDVSSPFLQAQLGALRRLLCGFWSLVPRFVFRVSCSVFRVEILSRMHTPAFPRMHLVHPPASISCTRNRCDLTGPGGARPDARGALHQRGVSERDEPEHGRDVPRRRGEPRLLRAQPQHARRQRRLRGIPLLHCGL